MNYYIYYYFLNKYNSIHFYSVLILYEITFYEALYSFCQFLTESFVHIYKERMVPATYVLLRKKFNILVTQVWWKEKFVKKMFP
jgi:hypothetical protein